MTTAVGVHEIKRGSVKQAEDDCQRLDQRADKKNRKSYVQNKKNADDDQCRRNKRAVFFINGVYERDIVSRHYKQSVDKIETGRRKLPEVLR